MSALHRLLRGRIHLFGLTETDFVMPPPDDPRVRRAAAGLELPLADAPAEAERQGRHGVFVVAWPGSGARAFLDALAARPGALRLDAVAALDAPDPGLPAPLEGGDREALVLLDGLHRLPPGAADRASAVLERWAERAPGARFVATARPDGVPPDRLGARFLEVRVAGLDRPARDAWVRARAAALHPPSRAGERARALLERLGEGDRRGPEAHRLASSPLGLAALVALDAADRPLPVDGASLLRAWERYGLPDDALPGRAAAADLRAFAETAPTPGATAPPHRWVPVPGGTFSMGSPEDEEGRWSDEGPVHPVRVDSFELAEHPVTNARWAEYLEACPAAPCPAWWDDPEFTRPDQPVVGVSWSEARAFARWSGARLPSEAEWEHACRAGTEGPRYGPLDEVAWYRGNSGATLRPVGGRTPTPWGVHDLLGNAWEWVEDDHHAGYEGAPADGRPWVDRPRSEHRILRGGSWADAPRVPRAATRLKDHPGPRIGNVGLRLARSPRSPGASRGGAP